MALKAFVLWGIEDDFGTRTKTVIWKLLWMLVASERLCISNEPCPRSLRWGGCLYVRDACLSFHTLEEKMPLGLHLTAGGGRGAAVFLGLPVWGY